MIPFSDLASIIGIAVGVAVVVGMIGLLALRLTRRSSMLLRVVIVVATAIFSVLGGVLAVAQAMYVSPHDLLVMFYIVGVSGVVSVGVSFALAKAFTRSSERLRMAAESLGAGQPVQWDSSIHDDADLATVAAELALTSERLAQAREQVAMIDASRRELVAWISHDLRTPLAGLRAMAEALEDELAEDPRRFHRQMRSQVDHLSTMVDDLFELSKINSGTLALRFEPVLLYDLVSDAVAELASLARTNDVTVSATGSRDITVIGDPRELSRVVGNLLINAIQHSPPGGEIAIVTTTDGPENVVVTVEDSGGGVPEVDLPKVFQAGWRASPSRTPEEVWERPTGAGLGLAIVRGIVEAHSGGVSVRNVPGGCCFEVRLPRRDAVAA